MLINKLLVKLTKKVISNKGISISESKKLVNLPIYDLLFCANKIRDKFFSNKIKLCSIVNAKSGKCSEDCRFCAQSSYHKTNVKSFSMIDKEKVVKAAKQAKSNKAYSLGIVTSGKGPEKKDILRICSYMKKFNVEPHASLGILTEENAKILKKAGLKMYNHNLETSQRLFSKICTTHKYSDRIKTIKIAKKHFKVCSGGIFGMGETWKDRIELAFTLKKLDVDCIPLNFLNPVKNTPMEKRKLLKPFEILRIIAIFRFINPNKTIEIAGGREKNLRNIQSWMYYSGANAVLTGNYLTTLGMDPKEDIQMIDDLELSIK
jgi:biotin synthase